MEEFCVEYAQIRTRGSIKREGGSQKNPLNDGESSNHKRVQKL